jgi:PAS domain S-box-containing protein
MSEERNTAEGRTHADPSPGTEVPKNEEGDSSAAPLARLLAGRYDAVGALLTFCDARWDILSSALEAKLRSHPLVAGAWRPLVTSSGWPSRHRVRRCIEPNGSVNPAQFLSILRDCGRSSSRAGLGLPEFTEAIQLVVDEITPLLIQSFPTEPQELTRLQIALQRCASVAGLVMHRDSSAEGERVLARGERRLVEAETKFSALWESGLLGVLVCDFHGNIRQANDGFLKTFGFTREDLATGQVKWNEMTPQEWRHLDEHAIAQLSATGKTQPWEKEYFHKDGSRVPVIVGVCVLNAEETIAFVLDVTERKHVEALRERSAALEAENRRVQEASRLKGEFLANMSHELRTPLNAITGFAELLIDGDVKPDSAEHDEFLRDILSAGLHLQRLISDVLDLAKIEAGNLRFHPEVVNLAAVIEEVCAVLRSVAADRGVEIETHISVGEVNLDPARLKQVLYNYLSNALKFSIPGSTVEVYATEEPGDKFRIDVVDHGIGIAPADVGKLFKEFQQLESGAAKRHQGTGLGLALTKRLVEAQGGSVGVQSEVDKGSRFYALLPKYSLLVSSEEEVAFVPVSGEGRYVLVVEDEATDRNVLVRVLGEAGYRTQTAGTGGLAIAACETQTFDAITLDLLLPDMTGLQVLQRIRQIERSRETPVLIVSVVAEQGVVRGFPVHDYLTKPIDSHALVRSLRLATSRVDKGVILVIDDDAAARRLMDAALTSLGYPVVCVEDGQAGLEFITHTRPVGIILDLMMPRMDGFEFLTYLRQSTDFDDVPVIVWTTKDLTHADRSQLGRCAQGTIRKGENPTSLVAELERLILRKEKIRKEAGNA